MTANPFPDAIIKELRHLMQQALLRIEHCVSQLSAEQIWWQPSDGQHSVGILLRHITGNLKQWALDGVRQTTNDRNRTAEFQAPADQSAAELLQHLRQQCEAACQLLNSLQDTDWLQPRTIQGFNVTVLGAFMHTIPHLVGHTHQITLLTRMQLGKGYQFQWNEDTERTHVPL